ncbi:MBL fold metallo-hydrolase [Pelagibacterium lacus]|uniref:MBL fold metallo-hydrolase n=1 Tax=Pelagibacterium lacus TaxID=2282655 RepID=A0A369W7H8_9HYPH|nr:MBL fold metallo-hydrolase [Pelagibacterium lacus]RDE10548.1 MBL fold metallo-hydrolase [Pelagibacterium lacus]
MPASNQTPVYSKDFDPQTGRPVPLGPGLARVTAPNASPYTFTGTNSYLIGERAVAVLDPGPDDSAHLEALLAAIGGREVLAVLLTHTHRDHCGLARRLMARTGASLWSGGPHRLSRPLKPFEINPFRRAGDFRLKPDRRLEDGEALEIDGVALRVVATPGHCANHLAFALPEHDAVLVGDHVMGWNSTVIATPDGDLGAYLRSLERLIALEQRVYHSGHGGPLADGPAFARALKSHRLMRNGQLLDVVGRGPISLAAAVAQVYPGLGGRLRLAAQRTLLSHAEYLQSEGRLRISRGLLGLRLLPR